MESNCIHLKSHIKITAMPFNLQRTGSSKEQSFPKLTCKVSVILIKFLVGFAFQRANTPTMCNSNLSNTEILVSPDPALCPSYELAPSFLQLLRPKPQTSRGSSLSLGPDSVFHKFSAVTVKHTPTLTTLATAGAAPLAHTTVQSIASPPKLCLCFHVYSYRQSSPAHQL